MKLGLFYEHQMPRPWTESSELKLFEDCLAQVELADQLGFDYLWCAEHHFLEEYAHSSAPDLFLAACSQRTTQIRLGHGIVVMLPQYDPPPRIAERLATLDLLSNGRVEWGTGESASKIELEGLGAPVDQKHSMWRESTEQVANMLTMTPYPGFSGKHFSMPTRNIVPKPVQKPHPPLWLACTKRESIQLAAKCGMGALTFNFIKPEEAAAWIKEYYDIIKSDQCVPIGHSVNPNIAMVTGFSCHEEQEKAYRNGFEGMQFFNFGLLHYYVMGEHVPGYTNLWNNFETAKKNLAQKSMENVSAIGTPDQVETYLNKLESLGLDQIILVPQLGKIKHEDICHSLNLFGDKVLPKFKTRQASREEAKQKDLAPYIAAALARKQHMKSISPQEIKTIIAYGGVGDLRKSG